MGMAKRVVVVDGGDEHEYFLEPGDSVRIEYGFGKHDYVEVKV